MSYQIYETLSGQMIKRLEDSAFIPIEPANVDYQKYLEWVAEGNTPEEWKVETV
jgi:hypothetical protein